MSYGYDPRSKRLQRVASEADLLWFRNHDWIANKTKLEGEEYLESSEYLERDKPLLELCEKFVDDLRKVKIWME